MMMFILLLSIESKQGIILDLKLPLKITDRAFEKIGSTNDGKMLRVAVKGGGCSGFQYVIELVDTLNKDDQIFEKDGNKVIIDKISLGFLSGAEIDFTNEIIGSRFQINNPNATSSCGCGTSFSLSPKF